EEPSYRVKPGQTFAIIIPDIVPALPAAQSLPLDILYEDSDVIVLMKPPGMAVHPGPGTPDRTLVNALIAHCGDSLSGIGGVRRPLGRGASLVECRLATGRTHQIRVHLTALGHPVIGDPVYGRPTPARLALLSPVQQDAARAMRRQALHAYRLGFRHPRSGEQLVWESDLPADIEMLIASLESV